MRTRQSLTAVVIALIVILIGVLLSLLTGNGPNAKADGPEPLPSASSAPPPTPNPPPPAGKPGTGGKAGGGTRSGPKRTSSTSAPSKSSASAAGKSTPPKVAVPPALGGASVPDGATYSLARDKRAFTMVFSTLESTTDAGRLSREQSTTIPVRGDAGYLNVLALDGYLG
ncbi:hypothetical protein [Actinoplanes sp. NPDC026619]|uniref:hypothetical protein n=1 Tax=Actinoplanes sp. NPDC026619 TaxID=3155798 RepID=UPI0033CD65A0